MAVLWRSYWVLSRPSFWTSTLRFHTLLQDWKVYCHSSWQNQWVLNLVNEICCQKNRAMDRIPSTKNALLKHIQHTIFQAGIWQQALKQNHGVIPSPDDFTWTENELTNLWVPVWMTIQRLASELIRCSRSPFQCRGGATKIWVVRLHVAIYSWWGV